MSLFQLGSALVAVVAVAGYANYKLVRLPDTIGVTAVSLLLSLGLIAVSAHAPGVAYLAQRVTHQLNFPELIIHGVLGLLLFAGSLHLDVGALARERGPLLVLSTIGVVISTLLVGAGFYYGVHLIGGQIGLMDSMLFGALVSPTDPIAALAMLSKARVPKSLLTLITGEALFNDGTGVVIFLVLLGVATGAQPAAPLDVALLLARLVLGGIVFGLFVGYAGFLLLRSIDSYQLEMLITLAMATAGYAAAEAVGVSAPIAVVLMGMVVGNPARHHAMSEQTRERLFPFWELTDDLLNLIVFALIGLELVALAPSVRAYIGPALIAIPIVLVARFVSVAAPIAVLRALRGFEANCVKLMTWGGLRGALSVALALSLPEQIPSRGLLVTAAYALAVFSILVQATTVEPLARYWTRRSQDSR